MPNSSPGVHAALASPVRRRVLDVLADAPVPPTAHQLAATLGLHVTTVRFHLDQLQRAGLISSQTERTPRRGRPAVHFRLADAEAPHTAEHMIDALAEALAVGSDAVTVGRRWADRLIASGPEVAVGSEFARLGFDPEQDGSTIRLRACPFRDAARRHPEVVCQVHLGLAQGLAGRDGTVATLAPFVEPEVCILTLSPAPRSDLPE